MNLRLTITDPASPVPIEVFSDNITDVCRLGQILRENDIEATVALRREAWGHEEEVPAP